MLQEWWSTDCLEVGGVGDDVPPVGDVEERCDGIGAELCGGVTIDEGRKHADNDEHEQQGGEQAPRAGEIEALEVDATGAVVLLDDEGRDEEARQDEEDIDAEESAAHPGEIAVVEQDAQDGQGPDAVEAREIAHLASPAAAVEMPGLAVGDLACRHRRPFLALQGRRRPGRPGHRTRAGSLKPRRNG